MLNLEVKYLSFGNLTFRLECPEPLLETEKYKDFFSKEAQFDFSVRYSFSEDVGAPPLNANLLQKGGKTFVAKGKNQAVFYNSACVGKYYAVRRSDAPHKFANVVLSNEAKGKFWARLALNTLGIEEAAARKNGVVFHSSFIETDNKAVLFAGPCSIGKSTQAQLWHENRASTIVNGDKTLLYLKEGKVFASGLPFSGSSNISLNRSMELRSIVFLEKGSENKVAPLNKKEAFVHLMKSSYVPVFCADGLLLTLSEIVKKTPICLFSCTPDERAVAALENFLKGVERF